MLYLTVSIESEKGTQNMEPTRSAMKNSTMQCKWSSKKILDAEMEKPDSKFIFLYSPNALSCPLAFQCKISQLFFILSFVFCSLPVSFFGVTSRQRELVIPLSLCFCMALKECMQPRILGYRCNIIQKKAMLFCD